MKHIPIEEFEKLTVQARLERLEKLNAKPSLFDLLILILQKWLYPPKKIGLLSTKVFADHRRTISYKRRHEWRW